MGCAAQTITELLERIEELKQEISAVNEQLFWTKVDRKGAEECWQWTAYRRDTGYGQFRVGERVERAHRVAFLLSGQSIPDGGQVLHHCDNPSCVNPAHLYLGTHADNMRDKADRARVAGERNPNARLSAAEVDEIRDMRQSGVMVKTIAEKFKIAVCTVYNICSGYRWAR
jgi:hypothetical protein